MRLGDWILTQSGVRFYPIDPRPDEVRLEDIAHALAMECRFGGQCRTFYSVADHSVRVSHIVPPADALWGLLHDASEAYLKDLPKPLKMLPQFAFYREAEQRLQNTIAESFGLSLTCPGTVHQADLTMLATEARDLMPPPHNNWRPCNSPLPETLVPRTWEHAKEAFLARYAEIIAARK